MNDTKKKAILEAATKIFARQGYQYATITEIAKEAGMASGLLYSYFENKLDLLLSIILIFLEELNQLNISRVAPLRHPLDKLYTFFHNLEDLLLKDDNALARIKILHEALPHIVTIKDKKIQDKRKQIMEANKRLIETVDGIMTEGQEQGVFNDTLNPAVMRQILSGSIERVIYGLFFETYSGEKIGYSREDGHQAIVQVIEKLIKK